jgi:hypothetical protein
MLAETDHEDRLPKGYRWADIASRGGLDQLTHYRRALLDLGNPELVKDPTVLAIFTDAQTKLRKPTNLKSLTTDIDQLEIARYAEGPYAPQSAGAFCRHNAVHASLLTIWMIFVLKRRTSAVDSVTT